MSRIYDALKRLEAERAGRKNGGGNGHGNGGKGGNGHQAKGNGNGHGNGHRANGHGNGNGNGSGHGNGHGNGHGKRRGWRWMFANGNGHGKLNGSPAINFQLAPDTEDAYQRLGTNLLGGPGIDADQPPKLLALTASRHGEGTTTTAALFASTLARRRGGRVAVVEANLRSPGFDQVFGIKRNGGFADLVLGQQTLAEVAQPTAIPGLFAVGCGTTTLAPSTLFDSPGLTQALEQLRGHFDFVVFDMPPVNVYGDSPILCPRLDAAVIVIEADRTRMPEVERTRRTLERVGVRLVGSVLNRRRNYIPAVLEEML